LSYRIKRGEALMGLRAHIDLHEWGFPDETPTLSLPIEYSGVGELFGTTT
jgi:hypothetical protein